METEPQTERRPKRTIWIVVACLFVVLAVFAVVGLERGEPSIRGRGLMSWIEKSIIEPAGSPAQLEARQAILDIGADAIPHLLFCLEGKRAAKDTVADYLMSRGYTKAAVWLVGTQPFQLRQMHAIHGFEVLGTNAVSALPQLVELLDQPLGQMTNKPIVEVQFVAARSLAFLGREGQLQLLGHFPAPEKPSQNSVAVNCVHALQNLKHFEPEVLEAVSRFATNSNSEYKWMALAATMNLEGNLNLKRGLLDWSLKSEWHLVYWHALGALEATPELIPEFRDRVAALGPLTDPELGRIRTRLLTRPQAVPK